MRLKVTHPDFTLDDLRRVISVVRPPSVSGFSVWLKWCRRAAFRGAAYYTRGHVTVSVGRNLTWPVVAHYPGASENFPTMVLWNPMEILVCVTAHELRHLWQYNARSRRGYYAGTRGRFSELDAEMYAFAALKRWRRQHEPSLKEKALKLILV